VLQVLGGFVGSLQSISPEHAVELQLVDPFFSEKETALEDDEIP
jgi:hypothetical protein